MKDCKVLCGTPTGAVWSSILAAFSGEQRNVMSWPTREGAEAAARMQGAAVIPMNQVRV